MITGVHKLINAGEDIYYTKDQSTVPKEHMIDGRLFHRFCDFILIPCLTENLLPQQVVLVNSIRAKYLNHGQFVVNTTVRKYFLKLIQVVEPTTMLELGPSVNPLISQPSQPNNCFLADFSKEAIVSLKKQNLICEHFGVNDKLRFSNNSIDLIFSIFVLQFNVSVNQIGELNRVLSDDGLVIANVYKRSSNSKEKLLKRFELQGFKCVLVRDSYNLCEKHEYWFLYKGKMTSKLPLLIDVLNTIPS